MAQRLAERIGDAFVADPVRHVVEEDGRRPALVDHTVQRIADMVSFLTGFVQGDIHCDAQLQGKLPRQFLVLVRQYLRDKRLELAPERVVQLLGEGEFLHLHALILP
ncbi:MAG: hypothetical protein WDN72_09145 [Alphaproteobacteria bacterium]